MIAYRYDPTTNLYAGEQERQLDPVASQKAGKGVYLMPADCTTIEPLEEKEGFNIKWNDTEWEYAEIPKEEEPSAEEKEQTTEEKIAVLDSEYEYNKSTLQDYYVAYLIAGDTDGMEEIKTELEALVTKYDSEMAALTAEGDE